MPHTKALRWLIGVLVAAMLIHIVADYRVYSDLRKAQDTLAYRCSFPER